jgi:hypothetical protein
MGRKGDINMNKQDLIGKVAEITGMAKADSEKAVNAVFDQITDATIFTSSDVTRIAVSLRAQHRIVPYERFTKEPTKAKHNYKYWKR